MEDINIMKSRKYISGYEGKDIGLFGLNREVISDFIEAQTVLDYDTEHFKYTNFNDPMFMYQDPLFPIFDIILDSVYSPLLTQRTDISSLRKFLIDYSELPGISSRIPIYNEFEKTLYTLFNKDFNEINRNKSYYINSINGLDKLTSKIVNFEKDKLTITMNDDISMITTYLVQLYNNLSYSYKDQRYMIPANLMRFNLFIKIHDVRNLVNNIPKLKPNDTNLKGEDYTTDFAKSYQIYYLRDCTFDFFKSKTFDDNITVGGFDASLSNKPGVITMDITYKSISIESGFPLIKEKITDVESSAIYIQNKASDLQGISSYDTVYINNQKSLDIFNQELNQIKSLNDNNNITPERQSTYDSSDIEAIKLNNKQKDLNAEAQMKDLKIYGKTKNGNQGTEVSGDVIVEPGINPQWKSANDSDTTFEVIQNYRSDLIDPASGGRPYEGDVQVIPGLDPQWKSAFESDTTFEVIENYRNDLIDPATGGRPYESDVVVAFGAIPQWKSANDSDTTYEIIQNYRSDLIDPASGGRPYEGDVELFGPGSTPQWYISDTSAPEIYAMKQSILNEINLFGFLNTLPMTIINLFMGGYHGMNTDMYIAGDGPGVIYGPRGGQNFMGESVVLDGDVIPDYPEGQLPNLDELKGDIIPDSIIQDGGIFSDPTVLDGENLNFQIPSDVLLETLYIPMVWNISPPLQGSIPMEYNKKQPIEGSIPMSFYVKDPLEGFIEFIIPEKNPLEGSLTYEIIPKELLEGGLTFEITEKDPLEGSLTYEIKPKDKLEAVISQEVQEKDPLEGTIDNSYREREFIEELRLNYEIILNKPLLEYIDTTTREKPEFNQITLYEKFIFERKAELGVLYLNITEENLIPIVYLYSKVNEFKSLEDYYVYNNAVSAVKELNATIDLTPRIIEPFNLIYSYDNNVDVIKTMQQVFVYDKEINKVNNMIVNYIFEEDIIKKEIPEIILYNNSTIPALMPFIYLYDSLDVNKVLESERLYQVEDNVFGNNTLDELTIDITIPEEELPISMGSVYDNISKRKEFTLPKLYEPSKIKKLLEPQLLYQLTSEKETFDIYKIYDDSDINIKNIFKPNLNLQETIFQQFGKRLDDVKLVIEKKPSIEFPYTTMSYVPELEIEKDTNREKTLDKERLEYIKMYIRKLDKEIGHSIEYKTKDMINLDGETLNYNIFEKDNLEGENIEQELREKSKLDNEKLDYDIKKKMNLKKFEDYKIIKPVLDRDSELAVKLEGDKINTDIEKRNSGVYGSITSLDDSNRIIEKEVVDAYKEPRKDPDKTEIIQNVNFKMPFEETYIGKLEDKPVVEGDRLPFEETYVNIELEKPLVEGNERLDGEMIVLPSNEPNDKRLEKVEDEAYESVERNYLRKETIPYTVNSQIPLDGETVNNYEISDEKSITDGITNVLTDEIKDRKYLDYDALDYNLPPHRTVEELYIDDNIKPHKVLDGEIIDNDEIKNNMNLNEERLDFQLKNKPQLDGKSIDYETPKRNALDKESIDYEIREKSLIIESRIDSDANPKNNLTREQLDYHIKEKASLSGEIIDYNIKEQKSRLNQDSLDYEINFKGSLAGESLDYQIVSNSRLSGEVLGVEIPLKYNLNGEVLDFEITQTDNSLNNEILDYEIKQKSPLNNDILDFEITQIDNTLNNEMLDYQIKQKSSLNNEILDYDVENRKNLNNEILDYKIKQKSSLNNDVLDFEITQTDNTLNNEILDFEIRQKSSLNNDILDYDVENRKNLNNEILDYEIKQKSSLNNDVLDFEITQTDNTLNNEILDYEIKQKSSLNNDVLDFEITQTDNSLNNEILDYEIKQKSPLNNDVLDFEITQIDNTLNNEMLDYQIKQKSSLNNDILDYEVENRKSLNNDILDYDIRQKSPLNNDILDFEITQIDNTLNNEILDYEIKQKSSLNNDILDYDVENRKNLNNEILDYEIKKSSSDSLSGDILDYETPKEKPLTEEKIDKNIKRKQGLNNERLR